MPLRTSIAEPDYQIVPVTEAPRNSLDGFLLTLTAASWLVQRDDESLKIKRCQCLFKDLRFYWSGRWRSREVFFDFSDYDFEAHVCGRFSGLVTG